MSTYAERSNQRKSSPTFEPYTIPQKKKNFFLAHTNYYWRHYVYFLSLGFFGGLVIFAIEEGIFTAFSACCVTGLLVVDFSSFRTGSQVVTLILICAGSNVLTSTLPVLLRRRIFKNEFSRQLVWKSPESYQKATEYRALRIVYLTAIGLYIIIQFLGFLSFTTYLTLVDKHDEIFADHGLSPVWFSLFHSISAFNNAGFCLLRQSLLLFNHDSFILLGTSILILIGNTSYPVLFRYVIYLQHKLRPQDDALKFILEHPRRCYTRMFPSFHTKVLAISILALTATQFLGYVVLEQSNELLESFPAKERSLISILQAVSTRTGGFRTIDLSILSPASQILSCIMMYISSYPVIAAVKRVPEARTRTIQKYPTSNLHPALAQKSSEQHEQIEGDNRKENESPWSQVKSSLLADSGLLIIIWLIICFAEEGEIRNDCFVTNFTILFEISSAYGTVGLSLGYPGTVTSFSTTFHDLSKFCMIVVMLLGRHRNTPRSIDHEVILPKLLSLNPERSFLRYFFK
eukprot:c21484_g1_i3.p1 GENE.c21484_g1_i3~~c21484_g1_i3.p1  ORF type:complete len:517 (+),score=181.15 c21484_g1_i3:94-1644(+)